ncbi:MAG TPA: hypothetical protein DCY03_31025 [Planctomycetaceae bacterium]|nr:hypothetical protein [Planctomycetaceae bacterium]|tara:strand:- start:526 stop:1911 length:1386 start_codon:yes stop_codon:yes gene_type:complete
MIRSAAIPGSQQQRDNKSGENSLRFRHGGPQWLQSKKIHAWSGFRLIHMGNLGLYNSFPKTVSDVLNMRTSGHLICVLFCFVLFVPQALIANGEDRDERARLQVIAELYKHNVMSFTTGRYVFEFSYRSAATEEDALHGIWNDSVIPATAKYSLYLDDQKFALKMDVENGETLERLESENVILSPFQALGNSQYALDWDGLVNIVDVHSPKNYRLSIRHHPFNLADDAQGGDPATFIENAIRNKYQGYKYEVDDAIGPEGQEVIVVKLTGKVSSLETHYYIDPNQGYLPVLTEFYSKSSGKYKGKTQVLEIRNHSGAYYPIHAIKMKWRTPSDRQHYVDVREMKVVEFDPSYKPLAEELSIRLPRTAQFSDGIKPNTAKSLYRSQEKKFVEVNANEIEGIYQELTALAEKRVQIEADIKARGDIETERTESKLPLLLTINAVVLCLIIGLYVIKKKRGSNS